MAAALCCPSVDSGQGRAPGFAAAAGALDGGGGAQDAAAAAAGAQQHHPIHFLYGHLHNSIRTELDNLSSWVLALEGQDNEHDLLQRLVHLKERYHFLEQVYKYHSSVEDEVVYPALDSKVKNVTSAYSVEHQDEEYLFEHLGSLLTAAVSQTGAERTATIRELICKVAEIHITLRKHLAKEEAQLLPLLLQHFSGAEQAELVAQFLYCIPLDTVERVLGWLKPMVPLQELTQLMAHLRDVIPDRLLLQLLVTWLNPLPPAAAAAAAAAAGGAGGAGGAGMPAGTAAAAPQQQQQQQSPKLVICPFAAGASKQQSGRLASDAASADTTVAVAAAAAAGAPSTAAAGSGVVEQQWPPLRAIVLFHHSIRGAMEVFASEAAALAQKPGLTACQVAGLVERHRFLRSVCMFHTLSEEEVMFPEAVRLSSSSNNSNGSTAADGGSSAAPGPPGTVAAACNTCHEEHCSEVVLFEELGRLLADVRAHVRRGRTRDVTGMLGKLVDTAKRACGAISAHMQREEAEVLPLLAAALGPTEQRAMVWHTLRAMPLRLLERVLPWLVSEVSQEDADGMMTSLRLGAPAIDQQLVELLLRWAQRGRWPVLPHVVALPGAPGAGAGDTPRASSSAAAAAAAVGDQQQQAAGTLVAADPVVVSQGASKQPAPANASTQQQQQQQQVAANELLHRQPSSGWAAHDPCLFGNNTCELRLIAQNGGSNGTSPRKRPRLEGQASVADNSSTDVTPTAVAAAAAAAAVGADRAGSSEQQVLAEAARALSMQRLPSDRSDSPAAAGTPQAAAAAAAAAAAGGSLALAAGSGAGMLPPPPQQQLSAMLGSAAAVAGGAGDAYYCSPIDHIFQFHKALKRELKQLEADAAALELVVLSKCEQLDQGGQAQDGALPAAPQQQQQQQGAAAGSAATPAAAAAAASSCPGAAAVLRHCSHALQQLDGRFHFLWGIYRAHSKAEDEIVFPALESKAALANVSRAYSLDHEQEEQLFHNLSAVLQRMRVAGSVGEARDLALQLRRMCAAVRASLETHVRAEEAELWPLFGEHFTVQEQQHLVGVIIGRTGAEVLQTLLPWVTGSFSEEEKDAMMDSLREATKHTMFDQWLDAVQSGNTAAAAAAAAAAGADASAGPAGDSTPPKQQQQQQQGLDADLPLAEIAGYLAATPSSSPLPGAKHHQQQQAVPPLLPQPLTQPLPQLQQQQQRAQPSQQQPAAVVQTEVSGTVAESTNYVPGWEDIFNINQKQLEAAIRRVSNDANLEPQRKAYLIQNIMVSRYIVAQQRRMRTQPSAGDAPAVAAAAAAAAAAAGGGDGAGAAAAAAAAGAGAAGGAHGGGGCCHGGHHHAHAHSGLMPPPHPDNQQQQQHAGSSAAAPAPVPAPAAAAGQACQTYADGACAILGCKHYRRAAQLVAPCCDSVHTCRLCHDDARDHRLDRYAVSEMVCMHCGVRQPVAGSCASCSAKLASYYCSICHLWDDEPGRSIYHCPFCNVCRRGQGLGVDFFHCMQCNACMSLSLFNTHTCRERAMEGNCPVCHEYLFDSSTPIKELPCGHFLHSSCFAEYARYGYTCPICCKSIGDMSMYFQMLDSLLAAERQSLPADYGSRTQAVLCQDCGKAGAAPYHWVYHACPHCRSYNTRML